MRAAYSEMLRRIQLEGLYRAEEQEAWRAGRGRERAPDCPPGNLTDRADQAEPPGSPEPRGACPEGPPQSGTAPREGAKPGPARPARGWSGEDVVECTGCWYWRTLDYTLGLKACWYPLLEDRLRPCLPADCYRRPGTPYRPCDPPEEG